MVLTTQTFVVHTVQQDGMAAVAGELMNVQCPFLAHSVTVMISVTGHAQKIVALTSGASVWE
jgi:ABC-type sulfate transport system permease subunit